jgi:hypothetical protein
MATPHNMATPHANSSAANEGAAIRCNNCYRLFLNEEELEILYVDGGPRNGCPDCLTDEYLMDLAGVDGGRGVTGRGGKLMPTEVLTLLANWDAAPYDYEPCPECDDTGVVYRVDAICYANEMDAQMTCPTCGGDH